MFLIQFDFGKTPMGFKVLYWNYRPYPILFTYFAVLFLVSSAIVICGFGALSVGAFDIDSLFSSKYLFVSLNSKI